MLLKLSLPKDKIIWALANPVANQYIHSRKGVGYQEHQLIVTEAAQPVEVTLEDYPKWAQAIILTSIHRGELMNAGDSIIRKKKEEKKVETKTVNKKAKRNKKTKSE